MLFTLLLFVCAYALDYNPVADPKSVVTFGRARFTVLTSNLIRMELSDIHSSEFDDRPTLQIVNRALPVPSFSVSNPNSSTVVITTSTMKLTHIADYDIKSDTCANPENGRDEINGDRVPDYPNGLNAPTQQACCSSCNSDRYCTAWVYAPAFQGINCWLMMNVQSTTPATGRIFGGHIGAVGFNSNNLHIDFTVDSKPVRWSPGAVNGGNLRSTIAALDCYSTKEQCDAIYRNNLKSTTGLLSTDGWYLLDDSNTARYTSQLGPLYPSQETIPWWETTRQVLTDLYFFGYGLDFRSTLEAYASVGGRMVQPPRTAFGIWWSRYYAYSQQQLIDEVLSGYTKYKLPLSHLVLDMDWHIEPNEPGCQSWGGYTFNTNLFPDPPKFISWLHGNDNILNHSVKLLLNVHPQTGVDHCQANYDVMARANGIDPATKAAVPCNFGNRTFANSLFQIYMDAEPLHGVDYWWTDYGGCGGPPGRELYWSNYYFDAAISTTRNVRPLVLSRYGGLGNHRYPIGFSGDTFQSFLTLQFLVEMTPTASNALFGYWSHDMGGFHSGTGSPGDSDPKNVTGSELLLRWLQFGSVAPILRTHCDHCERRIWVFPHFIYMAHAFWLRNSLVPYTYTESNVAFNTGVGIVHPLYYDYPQTPEAYSYVGQYMFGDSILAAPITWVTNAQTHQIAKSVWLPPGLWYNWNGTKFYNGPSVLNESYGVESIPLFVKSGHAIPVQNQEAVVTPFADPLGWLIFTGAGSQPGDGTVYEDDGETHDYYNGKYATTQMKYTVEGSYITISIAATSGSFTGIPQSRKHTVQLRGWQTFHNKLPSSVTVNGQTIPAGNGVPGYYISDQYGLAVTEGALVISTGSYGINQPIVIKVQT